MQTQWKDWLKYLKTGGKGGIDLTGPGAKPIDRGGPFTYAMSIPIDFSGDSFAASLRLSPDASGSTLADFAVTVGSFVDGHTLVTLSLTKVQTAALPADAQFDGLAEAVFDVLRTSGGEQTRLLGGVFAIIGKVTNYV